MSKTILLINPGYEEEEKKVHTSKHKIHRDIPPISLLYIGGYLHSYGYEVHIVDTHIDLKYKEHIKQIISNKDILFVGITVLIGDYLKNAIEISKLIKELDSSIPIVWGGAFPSVFPSLVLKEPFVDIVVRYEGEETTVELCKVLEKALPLDRISGIVFKKNGDIISNPLRQPEKDINKYPIPGWYLIGDKLNKKQIPYLAYLFTSRGCIYNCTFCYHQSRFLPKELKWRGRSAEHVLNEVDYLLKNYGINVFTIGDDNFLVDKERAKKILKGFSDRGIFIEQCVVSFFDLDKEIIDCFSKVCQTLIYSIESTVPQIQKLFGKQINLDRVLHLDYLIAQKGMNSVHNFIVCIPEESDDNLKSNVQFMKKLKEINPYVRGGSYIFLPLPGSPLFNFTSHKYNIKNSENIYEFVDMDFDGNYINFKARPWLKSKEDYQFYIDFRFIFNEVFKSNNSEIDKRAFELLDSSNRLKYIFEDIQNINHPLTSEELYILDKL